MRSWKYLLACMIVCLLAIPASASQVLISPKFVTQDDNGDPMGGCIYTYATGGNSPKATYSNKALTTPRTNPIQANARGEVGLIYLSGIYRITLASPSDDGTCPATPGTIEWTVDGVEGIGSTILDFTLLSDYASFASAISTIGATETELWGDEDTTLAATASLPATLKYRAIIGDIITLGNFDLTFLGPFEAGPHQVFNESGTGVVVFGPGSVEYVLSEWWGTGAAALQNAINCAIASDVPLKMLATTYTVASNLTAAGNFDWIGSGDYSGATLVTYTGTSPMFKSTAKLDNIRWEGFRVDLAGNANSNVDLFDFDLGVKQGHFTDIYIDGNAAGRDSFIIRGEPAAGGGVGNNNQYENVFTRVRFGGSSGAAMTGDGIQGGTELANGYFNGNSFINCTWGDEGLALCFNIAGNGNSFHACNFQNTVGAAASPNDGNYYGLLYGDSTYKNTFWGCYFDGNESVLFNSDTADNAQAPAEFFYCLGINYSITTPHTAPASTVHDYEGDGTSTVCLDTSPVCDTVGARIVVEDSRYHWNLNTLAGAASRGYDYNIGRSGRVIIRDDGGVTQTRTGGFADDYDGNSVTDVRNWAALLFGQSADSGFFRYAANDLRTINGDSLRVTKGFFGQGAAEEATLNVGGHLNIETSAVIVDTYADAATDDCVAITGGLTGDIITVRTANSARDVTLKDYVSPGTPGMINTYTITAGANQGTGYATNDVLTVVQAGASLGTITVITVDGGTGAILTSELTTVGTGYSVANNLDTTVAPAGGTGCKVNVTAVATENLYMPADCVLNNPRDMAVLYQRAAGEWNLLSCSDNDGT